MIYCLAAFVFVAVVAVLIAVRRSGMLSAVEDAGRAWEEMNR